MTTKRLIAALLITTQLTGCYSITADLRDGGIQPAARDRQIVRTIDKEDRCWFILGGLLPLNQPDIRSLYRELRPDERLAGSKVVTEYGPVDILFVIGAGILGGIVAGALGASSGNASVASAVGSLIGLIIPTSRTLKITADVATVNTPVSRSSTND